MTKSETLDFSISSLDSAISEKWSKIPLCIKTLWNSASNEPLFGRITPTLVLQHCVTTGPNINTRTVETEILSQQHNFTEVQQLTHHQKQHKVEINKYKKENANLRLSIERRDSEAAFISKDLKEKIGILAETNATVHKKAVLRPVADRVSSIIFY